MGPPARHDPSAGTFALSTAVLAVSAPCLALLCAALWLAPLPISEAVALFEDVARNAPSRFFVPETAYYRPLFHATLSALWHHAGSLEATLAGVRLLQIVPLVLLVVLFIGYLRPRTLLDAAAATIAVAVLIGSRGFRDNLEIPLSYTIIGMPLALLVWILLNQQPRFLHTVGIVALTAIAVGFKEQGLVIIPLAMAAWWTRALGAGRGLAVPLAALAAAYVVFRVTGRTSWPPFEQAVGLGFGEMEPRDAAARFGQFPYWIYAYTAASTILNVLFSEPTRGVFQIVRHTVQGHPEVWEMIHLLSSAAVTTLIAWSGLRALSGARRGEWSLESRLFVAMLVVLLATGALSFNYSRDRLGGMAVVFYALAAFYAVRAAAEHAIAARRAWFVTGSAALVLLAAAWQTRAVATIEIARIFALRNQTEWFVRLPERRTEFADRPVYLDIMERMIDQGTTASPHLPTRYPRWVKRTLGLP